jgi:hypothetical protein
MIITYAQLQNRKQSFVTVSRSNITEIPELLHFTNNHMGTIIGVKTKKKTDISSGDTHSYDIYKMINSEFILLLFLSTKLKTRHFRPQTTTDRTMKLFPQTKYTAQQTQKFPARTSDLCSEVNKMMTGRLLSISLATTSAIHRQVSVSMTTSIISR